MDEAIRQAANVVAPRKGAVLVFSVDSTARAYDLTGVAIGKAYDSVRVSDFIYVRMEAEGGDVYYHFDSATSSALNDTSAISAGGSVAFNNAYGARLPKDSIIDIRIDRAVDKFIVLKTSSGTAKLRFYAASQPSP